MSSPAPETGRLRVQAVFQEVDREQAQRIAAELIARAHELANLPECACDVDVSVEREAIVVPAAGAS